MSSGQLKPLRPATSSAPRTGSGRLGVAGTGASVARKSPNTSVKGSVKVGSAGSAKLGSAKVGNLQTTSTISRSGSAVTPVSQANNLTSAVDTVCNKSSSAIPQASHSEVKGGLKKGSTQALNTPTTSTLDTSDENVSPIQTWIPGREGCSNNDNSIVESHVGVFSDGNSHDGRGIFHVIEQLAALEAVLWSILDGLKSNATYVSFFCREYWGSSASQAQLSLEHLPLNVRLKKQVQQASVLESMSLAVASQLCSGMMEGVTVTLRAKLRNLLYYIHENCLVILDFMCQKWFTEGLNNSIAQNPDNPSPENLNVEILERAKRYRRLRKGEHAMALRQHNEMILNIARQLVRSGSTTRKGVGRGLSPRERAQAVNRTIQGRCAGGNGPSGTLFACVNDIFASRGPLEKLEVTTIRSRMLEYMRFRPLLNVGGSDPDCPWPEEDLYSRYGADLFAQGGPTSWFEPLPPMLPDLECNPKLPPPKEPGGYTLALDLDETLVHYFEVDGMGSYNTRPGMQEFIQRMNLLGYEIVIFTAATQDYANWVIDQIDPDNLIHHRLYRQHSLPWGPIFVKDLSRIGRDLERTIIIDNVQENFMLQPHNGIFIFPWYDDPHDTALFGLTPLLDELITTRAKVPEILDKYWDHIPAWAGFDQYSDLMGDASELEILGEDTYAGFEKQSSLENVKNPPKIADISTPTRGCTHASVGVGGGRGLAEIAQVGSQTLPREQAPPGAGLTSEVGRRSTRAPQNTSNQPAPSLDSPQKGKGQTFSTTGVSGPYQQASSPQLGRSQQLHQRR